MDDYSAVSLEREATNGPGTHGQTCLQLGLYISDCRQRRAKPQMTDPQTPRNELERVRVGIVFDQIPPIGMNHGDELQRI